MSNLDWSVLEIEGVEETAENATKALMRHDDYGPYVEYDDMMQEARIAVASMPDAVRSAVAGEKGLTLGAIKWRVQMDLVNKVKADCLRRQEQESADHRYSEVRDDSSAPPRMTPSLRRDKALYTRELVESLMPAVWDASYCYGMQAENAPDADMPRGSINKATGNTLAAHLVDIKVGWEKTNLTDKERRALFLTYCMDWTHHEIAYNQECARQVITDRLATAVGKVVAQLNGVDWHNWEEVAA